MVLIIYKEANEVEFSGIFPQIPPDSHLNICIYVDVHVVVYVYVHLHINYEWMYKQPTR